MAKTEDIEAKLAAYVDGELDAAGREEIEKHLATNSQHRQLIGELMRQRDLLRSLPRESAPLEVAETVNAQLERAVLLGDVDGDVDVSAMRIGYWPQVRALAAVLIFTVSLAAIIYYLLPSANKRPQLVDMQPVPGSAEVATQPSLVRERIGDTAGAPSTPLASAAPAESRDLQGTEQRLRAQQALRESAQGELAGVTTPQQIPGPLIVSNNASATNQMFQDLISQQMKQTAPPAVTPAANTYVYVVATGDPDAATRDLSRYLSRNSIAWETNAEPSPSPIQMQQNQIALADRLQSPTVQSPAGGQVQAEVDPLIALNSKTSAASSNSSFASNIQGSNVYDPQRQFEQQIREQQDQPLSQQAPSRGLAGQGIQQQGQQASQQQVPPPAAAQPTTNQLAIAENLAATDGNAAGTIGGTDGLGGARARGGRAGRGAGGAGGAPGGPGFGGPGGAGGGAGGGRRGGGAGGGGAGGGGRGGRGGATGGGFAIASPATVPATAPSAASLLGPGSINLNRGTVYGVAQSPRRIVARRVTAQQWLEIQLQLESIRSRPQAAGQLNLAQRSLTSVGLNGFPSVDDFTSGRLREIATENQRIIDELANLLRGTGTISAGALGADGLARDNGQAPLRTLAEDAGITRSNDLQAAPTTLPTGPQFSNFNGLSLNSNINTNLDSNPNVVQSNGRFDMSNGGVSAPGSVLFTAPTTQQMFGMMPQQLFDVVILIEPDAAATTQPARSSTTAPAQ